MSKIKKNGDILVYYTLLGISNYQMRSFVNGNINEENKKWSRINQNGTVHCNNSLNKVKTHI